MSYESVKQRKERLAQINEDLRRVAIWTRGFAWSSFFAAIWIGVYLRWADAVGRVEFNPKGNDFALRGTNLIFAALATVVLTMVGRGVAKILRIRRQKARYKELLQFFETKKLLSFDALTVHLPWPEEQLAQLVQQAIEADKIIEHFDPESMQFQLAQVGWRETELLQRQGRNTMEIRSPFADTSALDARSLALFGRNETFSMIDSPIEGAVFSQDSRTVGHAIDALKQIQEETQERFTDHEHSKDPKRNLRTTLGIASFLGLMIGVLALTDGEPVQYAFFWFLLVTGIFFVLMLPLALWILWNARHGFKGEDLKLGDEAIAWIQKSLKSDLRQSFESLRIRNHDSIGYATAYALQLALEKGEAIVEYEVRSDELYYRHAKEPIAARQGHLQDFEGRLKQRLSRPLSVVDAYDNEETERMDAWESLEDRAERIRQRGDVDESIHALQKLHEARRQGNRRPEPEHLLGLNVLEGDFERREGIADRVAYPALVIAYCSIALTLAIALTIPDGSTGSAVFPILVPLLGGPVFAIWIAIQTSSALDRSFFQQMLGRRASELALAASSWEPLRFSKLMARLGWNEKSTALALEYGVKNGLLVETQDADGQSYRYASVWKLTSKDAEQQDLQDFERRLELNQELDRLQQSDAQVPAPVADIEATIEQPKDESFGW